MTWQAECDHTQANEVIRLCAEFKCADCGQIKKRVCLEECLAGKDRIVML